MIFSNRKNLSKMRTPVPVAHQTHISKIWILGVEDRSFYFVRVRQLHTCVRAGMEETSNTALVHQAHFEIPPPISLPTPSWNEMIALYQLRKLPALYQLRKLHVSLYLWTSLWRSAHLGVLLAMTVLELNNLLSFSCFFLLLQIHHTDFSSTSAAKMVHFYHW